jgi:hypothetical protein
MKRVTGKEFLCWKYLLGSHRDMVGSFCRRGRIPPRRAGCQEVSEGVAMGDGGEAKRLPGGSETYHCSSESSMKVSCCARDAILERVLDVEITAQDLVCEQKTSSRSGHE